MYKQTNPRAHLSIERYTDNVPQDGKYYLLKDGKAIGSFRSLKAAQQQYQQMVNELALPPLIKEDPQKLHNQIMDLHYQRMSTKQLTGYTYNPQATGRNKHPK